MLFLSWVKQLNLSLEVELIGAGSRGVEND